MDVVVVFVGHLLTERSTMLRQKAVIKSKNSSARRRYRFYERQAQERLLFAVTMSLATARISSTPRTIWTRERMGRNGNVHPSRLGTEFQNKRFYLSAKS